jgi:hypothetical protein
MVAKPIQTFASSFPKALAKSSQVPLDFYRGVAITPFDDVIERLKAHYEFVQAEEIVAFLRSYSFLIADLNKIYEMKRRYFDETPMTLYYTRETSSLESVTLAAYIKTELPEAKAEEIFSQFDEEWSENISEEANLFIIVDLD